jgi:hypothetical protein
LLGATLHDAEQSAIILDFAWSDPSAVFAPPPASSACKCRLREFCGQRGLVQTAPGVPTSLPDSVPGGDRSPAFKLFADLQRLQGLFTVMEALDSGVAPADLAWPQMASVPVQRKAPLLSRADEFLASLGSETPVVVTEGNTDPTLGGMLAARTELDFTERLWDFVKGGCGVIRLFVS